MTRAFVLGALIGGVVIYLWQEEIREQVLRTALGTRERAAGGLEVVEGVTDRLLERATGPFRTAERALDQTREKVGASLRAGQERLRSSGPDMEPERR